MLKIRKNRMGILETRWNRHYASHLWPLKNDNINAGFGVILNKM